MSVMPDNPLLIVSPEDVAQSAGITGTLTGSQLAIITNAILDAQADVSAYLGREILPTEYVETDRYAWYDGWSLEAAPDESVISYVSVVAQLDLDGNPTDYFTVTYLAGIDAANDPTLAPIRRYVKAAAMNSPEFLRMWRTATSAEGEIRNLTAEGQSVSFGPATLGGGGAAGSQTPGALPGLGSLDRWRLAGRRVHQARSRSSAFPWGGMNA